MRTKKTILSEKEYNLLEEILSQYGIIVEFEQIANLLKFKMNRQSAKNRVNKLAKNGWLVRIKKGVYTVSSLESRGGMVIPTLKTAQVLVKESYVSFESALQYYGMFDQMLKSVVSVSLKRRIGKQINGIYFKFITTKHEQFFGWDEKKVENYPVKIAQPEKAVLDMLTFGRNIHTVNLVLDTLNKYKKDFDFSRLSRFGTKHSTVVQRLLGFLLDKINIDSRAVHKLIKNNNGCSFMTGKSSVFNAKWRLYYDKYFKT